MPEGGTTAWPRALRAACVAGGGARAALRLRHRSQAPAPESRERRARQSPDAADEHDGGARRAEDLARPARSPPHCPRVGDDHLAHGDARGDRRAGAAPPRDARRRSPARRGEPGAARGALARGPRASPRRRSLRGRSPDRGRDPDRGGPALAGRRPDRARRLGARAQEALAERLGRGEGTASRSIATSPGITWAASGRSTRS